MAEVITIVALSWFSNLVVGFYVDLCIKAKVKARKPFSCEKCLGFWLSLIYFSTTMELSIGIIIFASVTSLVSVILSGIVKRLNDNGI